MTERIDHVAEAQRHLNNLKTLEGQHLELDMHMAQVHATLALVDQQRIANVLYLARESHADIMQGVDFLMPDESDQVDFKRKLGL